MTVSLNNIIQVTFNADAVFSLRVVEPEFSTILRLDVVFSTAISVLLMYVNLRIITLETRNLRAK
jgi:hypothetical protein